MRTLKLIVQLLLITGFLACKSSRITPGASDPNYLSFAFLHINDVYEIAPLDGGRAGGMARVAQLKKELQKQYPNLLFVHAGDFLNPSLIGTMKYEGSRINGRHMVEVMNQSGVDLAIFGNHEFDLSEEEVQKRLNESEFDWISGNVLHNLPSGPVPFGKERNGKMIYFEKYYIWEIPISDKKNFKVGIFAVTLPFNRQPYVQYGDVFDEAKKDYQSLKADTDLVLGLTHLELEDDVRLAEQLPDLPLIIGGHDHENMLITKAKVRIAKADANAKTAYLHHFTYDLKRQSFQLESKLIAIDQNLEQDPDVAQTVDRWTSIAEESFKKDGFDANEILATLDVPLDGRESSIRNKATNLGELIAHAMLSASQEKADAAILNAGSIRVDDQLRGNLTQYDVIRTLPFGGKILEIQLRGALLKEILDAGLDNKGTGGYLHYAHIQYDPNLKQRWVINDIPLSENKLYTIALSDFLLTGRETGLDFLTSDHPSVLKVFRPHAENKSDLRNDLRLAVIHYLKTEKK